MKPGLAYVCIIVAVAMVAALTGCSTTYHRSPGGPLLAGGCERDEIPPAEAECGQWNELLDKQRDEAGRERIRGSMPAMCVNAPAGRRAPKCWEEQKLDGKGTLVGIVLIGATLFVGGMAVGGGYSD